MTTSADTATQAYRFNEAVRSFTPPIPGRHAKLMPFKDGIVELRRKGASLRLIRELLAAVDLAVSIDTIARFLADLNVSIAPEPKPKRASRGRTSPSKTSYRQPLVTPPVASPTSALQVSPELPSPSTIHPPDGEALSDQTRTRGPRIADPANL